MKTRLGIQCLWTVQHCDADGNPKGEPIQSTNHYTRRGAIEIFERVHPANIDLAYGGPTFNWFLGSFAPFFALVAKDPLPSYHREDRLGWSITVGDGKHFRNFSWFLIGARPSDLGPSYTWANAFTHQFTTPVSESRTARLKINGDPESSVADITSNLNDKRTSFPMYRIRRSLKDYNESYGPSIWHIRSSFPTASGPIPNLAYPNPDPGNPITMWAPLALGIWPGAPNHDIDGKSGDIVEITYTIDFNLSFV